MEVGFFNGRDSSGANASFSRMNKGKRCHSPLRFDGLFCLGDEQNNERHIFSFLKDKVSFHRAFCAACSDAVMYKPGYMQRCTRLICRVIFFDGTSPIVSLTLSARRRCIQISNYTHSLMNCAPSVGDPCEFGVS